MSADTDVHPVDRYLSQEERRLPNDPAKAANKFLHNMFKLADRLQRVEKQLDEAEDLLKQWRERWTDVVMIQSSYGFGELDERTDTLLDDLESDAEDDG